MPHTDAILDAVVARLDLQIGDADHAYGQISGSPAAITLIGLDPLSLLVAYKIRSSHPTSISVSDRLDALVKSGQGSVSLEDGTAWLSLDDLTGESADSIADLLEQFGDALEAAGINVNPGCQYCGCLDDVQLLFVEGSCSRTCSACFGQLIHAKEAAEHELNRPSLTYLIGLPLAALYAAVGWLVVWYVVDELMRWQNAQNLEIPGEWGILFMGAILVVIGFGVGYPLGIFLRKSGAARKLPLVVSIATAIFACGLGEFFFVTVVILQQAGVWDLGLAMQWFVPFIESYHPSWIVIKILVMAAIAAGCCFATVKKVTVPLQV